jgi:hypothetical protein
MKPSGNRQPSTKICAEKDKHPDAWERFEHAVDAAVQGGPRHRETVKQALSTPATPHNAEVKGDPKHQTKKDKSGTD